MLFNRTAIAFIVGFSAVIVLSFVVMVYAGKRVAEQEAEVRASPSSTEESVERGR